MAGQCSLAKEVLNRLSSDDSHGYLGSEVLNCLMSENYEKCQAIACVEIVRRTEFFLQSWLTTSSSPSYYRLDSTIRHE